MDSRTNWDRNADYASINECRRARRFPVLKHAKIVQFQGLAESICIIRNMSANGAELDIGFDQTLPEEFSLYVRVDGLKYRCKQIWRDGVRLGVEFVGTEK